LVGKWLGSSDGLVHAEFVALDVSHGPGLGPSVVAVPELVGAQALHAGRLRLVAVGSHVQIEMNAILRDLCLRDALEEKPWSFLRRVTARRNIGKLSATVHLQGVVLGDRARREKVSHQIGVVLLLVTEGGGPKASHGMRVCTIDRHLNCRGHGPNDAAPTAPAQGPAAPYRDGYTIAVGAAKWRRHPAWDLARWETGRSGATVGPKVSTRPSIGWEKRSPRMRRARTLVGTVGVVTLVSSTDFGGTGATLVRPGATVATLLVWALPKAAVGRQLSSIHATTQNVAKPRLIDSVEWFGSPSDLCAQYAHLYRIARRSSLAPVSTPLSINDGGIGLSSAQWPLVWFKGGSESGVLTLGYLGRSATGKVVIVLIELSDPSRAIRSDVTLRSLGVVNAAFRLAVDPPRS
jgi:hypothetical protein